MTFTNAEQHIINKGNVMLSQAGMPLMTDEQEERFILKQRQKKGPDQYGALYYGLPLAIAGYFIYRMMKA